MIPIRENPFVSKNIDYMEKAKAEIIEFVKCDCNYAELPAFEKVVFATSVERYKKAVRHLRFRNLTIRTSKGRIIACKDEYFYANDYNKKILSRMKEE